MGPSAARSTPRWFGVPAEAGQAPSAASSWLEDFDDPAAEAAPVAAPPARGLSGPLPGIEALEGLPFRVGSFGHHVAVVGAHGGAGEDTLAALDPELLAPAGHAWPSQPGGPVPVIVTARSSHRGLRALQAAGRQHAAGALAGLEVLGAVVIDDAPRVPRQLEQSATLAGGLFPRLWRLPFTDELRLAGGFTGTPPKAFARLVNDVRALHPRPRTAN